MTHANLRTTTLGVVALAFLVLGSGALASEKIAEQENLVCTSCHDKPGSKLLTDEGKFYELMGSMDGLTEVRASFEECTACHVRKPGSKKLTKKGQMFSFAVKDMDGLVKWVRSEHPGWPGELDVKVTDEGEKTPKEGEE